MRISTVLRSTVVALAASVALFSPPADATINWRGWSEIPGGGQTPSTPTGVWFKPEKLVYLFARGFDDRAYFQTTFKSYFSGWIEVPGNGLFRSSFSAVVWFDQIYLFGRGYDDRIYVNTKAPSGAWSGWFTFVSHQPTAVSPAAVVVAGTEGQSTRLIVYYRTGSGQPRYLQYTLTFGTWVDRELQCSQPTSGVIAASSRTTGTGNNYVYMTRNDGAVIWTDVSQFGTSPDGWTVLGNGIVHPGGLAAAPHTEENFLNSTQIFATGLDHRIYRFPQRFYVGDQWSEVPPGGGVIDGPPGAMSCKVGRKSVLIVFGTGFDSALYWQIGVSRYR